MSFANPSSRFQIKSISMDHQEAAYARQAQLTKPAGSLGDLEALAIQLASVQQTSTPSARPAQVLIFAADHPVVQHGVSAFPKEVTPAMVHNILNGGAACSVLAQLHRLPLDLVDVGVNGLEALTDSDSVTYHRDADAADGVVGDLANAEAMSHSTFEAAVSAGRDAVDRHASVNLLLIGELGIGNTTAAAAVSGRLMGVSADRIVGRGTGVDDAGLARKIDIVAQALERCTADTPAAIIQQIGGRDIAAMYGAMGRAAEREIAVIVDGFIASTAALALIKDYPLASQYFIWGHRSAEAGHQALLEAAAARGLLDLGLRLGEASGALTCFPLIEAACAIHCNMATFADAHVPDRDD